MVSVGENNSWLVSYFGRLQLIRPDGWSLVLRKVHLASGNPKDRLYLVHPTEEQGEFSLARWEKRWDAWKKTARPGATGPETAAP